MPSSGDSKQLQRNFYNYDEQTTSEDLNRNLHVSTISYEMVLFIKQM